MKMIVAYILTFDPTVNSGLWSRLKERLDRWTAEGVVVHLFVVCRPNSELFGAQVSAPHHLQLIAANNPLLGSLRLPKLVSACSPDLVYMRYNLPYPGMIWVTRRHATVLEIHADDTAEWAHRPLRYQVLGRVLRNALLRTVSAFVFVDPDLRDATAFPSQQPRAVITNGICIDHHSQYGGERRRLDGPPRLLLALGNEEIWQGVDKYAELARMLPDLEFHVVGPAVAREDRPANLKLHGRLEQSSLRQLLSAMDFGVGNLGLERIGRRHASPLKVREYIQAGLPCIIAHDDPDIAGLDGTLNLGYGFVVAPLPVAMLSEFVRRWLGRACSTQMAEAVSVKAKEFQRLRFLREVLEDVQVTQ